MKSIYVGNLPFSATAADEAIRSLNGADFGGRTLKVNEAKPREERRPRW